MASGIYQISGTNIDVPAYILDGIVACHRRYNTIRIVVNGWSHFKQSATSGGATWQAGTVTVTTDQNGERSISDFTAN